MVFNHAGSEIVGFCPPFDMSRGAISAIYENEDLVKVVIHFNFEIMIP